MVFILLSFSTGLLCSIHFFGFFYWNFGQKSQACKRALISQDNPTYYFCFFNNSNLWQLIILALFINKKICSSSYTLVDHEMVEGAMVDREYRVACALHDNGAVVLLNFHDPSLTASLVIIYPDLWTCFKP